MVVLRFLNSFLHFLFFVFLPVHTPDMEFNKFVTLWIFSLCLVEKCWTDRTSSSTPEIQVVENGVSGKLLIILIMCENSHSCILFIHLLGLAEKHHWLAGNVLLFVPHLCDSGTICSPAENSPAGSPLSNHLLRLPKCRDYKNLIK